LNPQELAPARLFYERRIDSFEALVKEAASMDADAGLRVLCRHNGQNCYAFVTRFGSRYTVMVYERKAGKREVLGRRLAVEDLEGIKELEHRLREFLPGRVRAFAY
jgi:hypothetical protein